MIRRHCDAPKTADEQTFRSADQKTIDDSNRDVLGQQFIGLGLWNILNDDSQAAALANWTTYELADVKMRNYNALQPLVTGRRVVRLAMDGCGQG